MREIKFRAWDQESNKMSEGFNLGTHPLWANESGDFNKIKPYWTRNGTIIMQYTGLKDKNGKEIYPGDIINWTSFGISWNIGFVVEKWGDVGPCKGPNIFEYRIKLKDTTEICNLWNLSEMEVIGNIYENPELIEG